MKKAIKLMKRYGSILLLLVLAGFVYRQAFLGTQSELPVAGDCDYFVEVIAVSDGDTFTGRTGDNEEVRFRIQGIDAPELSQAFSRKSRDYLAGLIQGKRVCIKVQREEDGFGRPVVYAFTPDNRDVGAEMIKAGMAWHFKKYDSSDLYSKLEEEARAGKVGLWRDQEPIAPWIYRAH